MEESLQAGLMTQESFREMLSILRHRLPPESSVDGREKRENKKRQALSLSPGENACLIKWAAG